MPHMYRSASSYIWNNENTTQNAAEFTQLRQPNDQTSVGVCMLLFSPMVVHVNYAKNVLERRAILGFLVLGLFRPFNKIEFSADRYFQKCSNFVKAF